MKSTFHANQLKEVISTVKQRILYTQGKNNRYRTYFTDLRCGFDIETTTLENRNAYMYVWQFSINDFVFIGRTWNEFLTFLDNLKECICVNKYSSKKAHVIIWVANLGFEFQFIRKKLKINKLFAKKEREPLYFIANDVFEFRDCLAISGGNLAFLADMYCKTKKLIGDLDYKLIRNNLTSLKKSELKYCINDVKILSEFADYIFKTYVIPKHNIPLTKTGIVRNEIKEKLDESIYSKIYRLYPKQETYNFIMKYLFRGGYTHANALHAGIVLKNVVGIDFKSSYPYVMCAFKYPMSKFIKIENATEETIKQYSDNEKYAYFIIAEFHNLRASTWHAIESISKVIDISTSNIDKFVDNGRITNAKYMKVCLTNYDFEIYKKLYKWDNCVICEFQYCYVDNLPDYLIDTLLTHYENKEKLTLNGKKNTLEYRLEKGLVNSNYGMCVTRINTTEIDYIDDVWYTLPTQKTYEKMINEQFLLPQWGIWITSIARWNLLRFFSTDMIGNDVVYSDTDSIYMINYDKHKHLIDSYNNEVQNKMYAYFSSRLENEEEIKMCSKLGTFDKDPVYTKFKTLGAKRYIKTYVDKGKEVNCVTIAGLPKNSLTEYCENNNLDIYETFQNDMYMNFEFSHKNAHKYNDDPHSDYVNGVLMHEDSSCGIYATTFKLNLDELYTMYIKSCKDKDFRGDENEIY